MAQLGTWGGNVEIVAAARALRARIVVWQAGEKPWEVVADDDDGGAGGKADGGSGGAAGKARGGGGVRSKGRSGQAGGGGASWPLPAPPRGELPIYHLA
jgi:hypothetical protein